MNHDHPTPHCMRSVRPEQIETSARVQYVWAQLLKLTDELTSIEADTPDVSIKAAVAASQEHVIDAIGSIRTAFDLVGRQ